LFWVGWGREVGAELPCSFVFSDLAIEICVLSAKMLQGFEAYVGLLLLRTAFVGVVSEWQVREHLLVCCKIKGKKERGGVGRCRKKAAVRFFHFLDELYLIH